MATYQSKEEDGVHTWADVIPVIMIGKPIHTDENPICGDPSCYCAQATTASQASDQS